MRARNGYLTILLVLALPVAACSSAAAEASSSASVAGKETNTPLTSEPANVSPTYDYTVVDTGQNTCYDDTSAIGCPQPGAAFYGQDAQYQGNQPRYVDNGDPSTGSGQAGTITDLNTGLMWQKTPDLNNKSTWEEAVAGADSFELAGYDDWRLPTIKELYSLIDFRGNTGMTAETSVPYIDTDYFDFVYGNETGGRLIDAQYWSSTKYVGTTGNGMATVFGVNFADGRIKGYGLNGPGGSDMKQFVRYVRGNPGYGVNNFVDNGDPSAGSGQAGTITDRATGLMWMKADSGTAMDWEEALAYAENLEYAGYDDWRLPNAKELQSIVDYTRAPDAQDPAQRGPAIDPIFDVTETESWFWTSTTHVENNRGSFAVYIAFGQAYGVFGDRLVNVHGAGAQRSSPKSGNQSDWAGGHGPQNDEIRITNYVRCVRGGATAEQPTGEPGGQPTTGVGGQPGGQPPTGQPGGQPPTGGQPASGERPDAGGRVTAVDGTTIRVENPHDGAVTIVTNASTEFRVERAPGSLADVAEGKFVMAFGEMQNDGTLLATLIIVSDAPPSGGQGQGTGQGGPPGPGQGPKPGQGP